MKIRKCLKTINLERCILYLGAASFLVWIILGIYFLPQNHATQEPGRHSGRHQWRIFREDDPNPLLQKRPPLLFEKLSDKERQTPSAPNADKQTSFVLKNQDGSKGASVKEKLEQIHKKKLNEAGFKVDDKGSEKLQDQSLVISDNKHNPVLNKLLRLHENKLNKAGFDVQFNQGNAPKLVSIDLPPINYNVHLFYYPWYGNPETDGKYLHWNHRFLPHWNKAEMIKWPLGIHKPPDDIGANFYPSLGPYSSGDPDVLDKHMTEIRSTGAGVVSVSWYPSRDADDEGIPSDRLIPLILDKANKYDLKVTFHIEPYKNRNHLTLRADLQYILNTYGQHPAFYRMKHKGRQLPLYYIYDSYHVQARDWAKIFSPEGEMTVRGTDLDGIFIGLIVEKRHREDIYTGGFDGYYTYFASNGFTYGSTWRNWGIIQAFARAKGLLFLPSVGPGYVDTRVRPWNSINTKSRDHGKYYEMSFEAAVNVDPPLISITSYNEWHEGTQIESAVPKRIDNFIYDDYAPGGPRYYLDLTKKWIAHYSKRKKTDL
ncbi:glycoprotein endo-alpha-1,2-mannosidase-like [Haliotis cracherodii]|uniref:glycoprotein endo-alpha-1,2-mannosidase-like n=1 Tax=Haliotis cracherodii TaxID=6455 RepID=UPI0039EAD7FF